MIIKLDKLNVYDYYAEQCFNGGTDFYFQFNFGDIRYFILNRSEIDNSKFIFNRTETTSMSLLDYNGFKYSTTHADGVKVRPAIFQTSAYGSIVGLRDYYDVLLKITTSGDEIDNAYGILFVNWKTGWQDAQYLFYYEFDDEYDIKDDDHIQYAKDGQYPQPIMLNMMNKTPDNLSPFEIGSTTMSSYKMFLLINGSSTNEKPFNPDMSIQLVNENFTINNSLNTYNVNKTISEVSNYDTTKINNPINFTTTFSLDPNGIAKWTTNINEFDFDEYNGIIKGYVIFEQTTNKFVGYFMFADTQSVANQSFKLKLKNNTLFSIKGGVV